VVSGPAAFRPDAAGRRARADRESRSHHRRTPSSDDRRLAARLHLLEGFLGITELTECAQHALQWLADHVEVRQSLCLARTNGHTKLVTVGRHGVPGGAAGFALDLDDWTNTLVDLVRAHQRQYFAPAHSSAERRRRPATPLGDSGFQAIPLGDLDANEESIGLLLISGAAAASPDLEWFISVFGQKLHQIVHYEQRLELDHRLGRERSLLYSIINAVTDPILLTDTEGRLVIANTRALTLFTSSEEDSEGRRGAVRMNNMLLSSALSSKAIEASGAARRELLLVNPVDGSDLLFELLSTISEDPRHGTGVVSILRNVSDLRRASEEIEDNYRRVRLAEAEARVERDRLNLIIDSVADPIVVTDAGGATSLMNEPAGQLFTHLPGAESAVQRAVQVNDAHFSTFIAGMLVSADRRRIGELALIDPASGAPMPVEAIAGKILSDQGELTAVVTILHDRREAIEKARLYEQLKEASDELERKIQAATADIAQQNELLRRQAIELEQASMLKSQFLANMSHEFRTPLNAMLGYTSMLLQGVAGPIEAPVRRQLARIESNGRHLLTIINEILDISRIEAGRMPLQISRFRIPELVNEVRAELEPIIIRTKLNVTIHLGRDLRPISSDRQKVKQILLNLLSNALKFTHEGSIAISARRRVRERALELSVADTGIGIAPADQERIFEDFRQLDNSPTRAYGGTGLGLSICRRLAQMLGGTMSVQSQPGVGSRFTLVLPLQGRR
jgi:signal transduction histidine kinase/PAS domain-containing protein